MSRKSASKRWNSPACALAASTILTAIPAMAQSNAEQASNEDILRLDSIVTSATRTDRNLGDIPQQVDIIRREDILRQAEVDSNLTNIIGQLIPGISPPQADGATEDFTIRGRPVFLLIDGVPQGSNIALGTQFFAIDPAAIERIEVVRGASAIYGEGATGGIINIITRSLRDEEGIGGFAGAAVRLQSSSIEEDTTSYRAQASLSGRYGPLSALIVGSIDEDQGFFDGNGNLIPPQGPSSFNRLLNLLVKAGVDIDENQSAEISFNIANNDTQSSTTTDPSVLSAPIGDIAIPLEIGDLDFQDPPEVDSLNLSVSYSNTDLFGSNLTAQFFYRTSDTTGTVSDLRGSGVDFLFPLAPVIFQTNPQGDEIGGRLVIETPVFDGFSLTYGGDIIFDDVEGPFNSIDPVAFDDLRQVNIIDTPNQVPPYNLRNLAAFAQFEWQAVEQLRFTGGVRFEDIELDVDDFFGTPFAPSANFSLNPTPEVPFVQGGNVSTNDFVFNFGAIYDLTDRFSVTGNFSQGFSIPVLGFALGTAAFGDAVEADDGGLSIAAQQVTNFEGSIRYNSDRASAAISGFWNTSENGISFAPNPDSGFVEPIQAPQRNFGVEFDGSWRPFDPVIVGGSVTWVDGNLDADNDGVFAPLSSVSAPPVTVRGFLQYQTLSNWSNRIQFLTVADRNRAFPETDMLPVEGYTTVDISSELTLGQVSLSFSIQNLLDEFFIPASSQTETIDSTRFAGLGRLFTLGVSTTF
ncbi:MAG: TonB-dependent receptor [Pseudomonadota bacterium]